MKNKELEDQVNKWIEIANEDLILAEHAFTLKSNIPYRLIGYHAQQAAEKYLKAFLVSRFIEFPYTHNIELLINLVSQVYNIKDELNDAVILTGFAIAKRYPSEYEKVTKEDAKKALSIAKQVIKKIHGLLVKDGFIIN